jgi:hypothetical protein
MKQQAPIAAPRHSEPVAHETGCAIAQIMAFPATLGHVVETEENGGDLAVACALLPSVEGAQGNDEPVSATLGQRAWIRTWIAAGQAVPQSDRGVCTHLEEGGPVAAEPKLQFRG